MKSEKLKIGVLGCGYECDQYINEILPIWFASAKEHDMVFSFVYGQFKEYADYNGENEIKNPDWYEKYKDNIDYFFTPKPGTEAEFRNIALKPLIEEGCDIVIILDLQDELYTLEEIARIAKFVDANPFAVWFRGSLKNYVFDDKTYLRDAFTPARIYRTKIGHLTVLGFRFDNEVVYQSDDGRQFDHLQLPCVQIPKNVAFTRHLTWISNAKSKSKLEYQKIHFKGAGPNSCSYRWNDAENKLEFNPFYYAKMGLPIPELVREN